MKAITINGKPADITIETEKTVGELLLGLDSWFESIGQYLQSVEIDGSTYGVDSVETLSAMPLDSVSKIDVKTVSVTSLFLEALLGVKNDLENPGGAPQNADEWAKTYTATFLEKHSPDIHGILTQTLGGKLSPQAALTVINERIREIQSPAAELAATQTLSGETSKRLEDLPLDIQTGKDGRAAETITLFSALAEKLFRIFFVLKQYGVPVETLSDFLGEFGSAVKEFQSAWDNKDTVLAGDLAEYELSPRLSEFTSRLNELAKSLISADNSK
jgi:hypothetical protein